LIMCFLGRMKPHDVSLQAAGLYMCCLVQIEHSGNLSGIMQAVKLCWRCIASWWIETEWQGWW